MNDIEKIHQRAARIIPKIQKLIPDSEVFKTVNWDEINFICKKYIILVFKHKVYFITSYRTNIYELVKFSDKFEIPRCSNRNWTSIDKV